MKPTAGEINPARAALRANPHALPHLVGEVFYDADGMMYRMVRDDRRAAYVRDSLGKSKLPPALASAARNWMALRPEFTEWGQALEVAAAAGIALAIERGGRFAGLVARLAGNGTAELFAELADGSVHPLSREVSRTFDRLKPVRRLTRRGSAYRRKD
jgi:hypothetical protein